MHAFMHKPKHTHTHTYMHTGAALPSLVAADLEKFMTHVEHLSESLCNDAPWSHGSSVEWDSCTAAKYIDGFLTEESARREAKLYVQTVCVCVRVCSCVCVCVCVCAFCLFAYMFVCDVYFEIVCMFEPL